MPGPRYQTSIVRRVIASLHTNACVLAMLGLLLGMPMSTWGQTTHEHLLKARNVYTGAQRHWQQELAQFLTRHQPDLQDLIALNRDLQLAMIERRSLEFQYLLKVHPERIVTDQGIARFANFDWSDQDAEELRRVNPAFAQIEERIKDLRQRNDSHPNWPALREAYQSLAKDPEYQVIYKRFQEQVAQAEKILAEAK